MSADPKVIQLRFSLEGKPNVSIKSFVIKETNGDDEENAAVQAKAKGGVTTVFEELVRLSITYVDDVKVEPPLEEYDAWSSRTRAFVLQAFKSINSIKDQAEIDSFLSTGAPLPV